MRFRRGAKLCTPGNYMCFPLVFLAGILHVIFVLLGELPNSFEPNVDLSDSAGACV